MPFLTAKPTNLPPRYNLRELTLPAVLPTDAAELTALLHAVSATRNDVKTQALGHMQHMMEQFVLARDRVLYSEQSSSQGRLPDVISTTRWGAPTPAPSSPAAKTVDDVEALLPWNMREMNDGDRGAPTGYVQ